MLKDTASIDVVLYILELSRRYGIPTIANIIHTMKDKKVITLEDVKNLEMQFKDPKSYFPGYKE
jgi:hypothetical protein